MTVHVTPLKSELSADEFAALRGWAKHNRERLEGMPVRDGWVTMLCATEVQRSVIELQLAELDTSARAAGGQLPDGARRYCGCANVKGYQRLHIGVVESELIQRGYKLPKRGGFNTCSSSSDAALLFLLSYPGAELGMLGHLHVIRTGSGVAECEPASWRRVHAWLHDSGGAA